MNEYVLLAIFFFIALFYSSVGFGGGSSYLAILALVLTDFYEIRTLALLLNILVVSIGTFVFIQKKIFDWKVFWPFLVLSVPLAFIGARFRLSETLFFIVLGAALMLAAIMLLLQSVRRKDTSKALHVPASLALGGGIGLISGIVGIGGGIFLSPTLNLVGWKSAKVIAALASVFILVNSIAGVSGLLVAGTFQVDWLFASRLLVVVAIGALVGSRLSIQANKHLIQGLTAILVMYVGVRIVLNHGFGIFI